ncbi:MAG TPA: ParB/RepB/Spo0J family partition protein [Candidatus Onthousia excrementipullorum]|uniref:ParB/RepB/Spo0J family partition protein n=1 Tax=Candidatus Onthousia excrementipullorum TaxID=2840884 RepID=A0A9D1DV52_9FIRM|nr:ParB/RepB/Spo0J family partition protein [Candidatus Onthousia excrementipullorum]
MDNKENEVVYLHLDDIIPNRFQPRQVFDEKALKELAVSIKEHGVIQPIIVRNIGNKYEIIAGERRYKASAMAGLTTIPAIVRNLDDKESSKVALLENLQRKNLNPIEEAKTYQKILELDQMTQEELAKTMGKSQSAVANKLRLLSLTDEVQDALLKDQISERHARALLNAKDPETQKQLLKEVIDKKMTVRELEEKINPKEEITKSDIDALLNPSPVSATMPQTNSLNINSNSNPNNDFNTSVGIDYSTPPKFIDYDVPNINDNLESTANKSIDINAIKDKAQDINVEKPTTDVNEFLKVAPKEEKKEEESNFKFFSPMEEEAKEAPSKQEPSTSMFDTPAPTNAPFINDNPFNLGGETKDLKDSTSTSMDNLLAGVNTNNNTSVKETPSIPSIDTFNNPFAHNPIFSDNVKASEEQQKENKPKYTLNESINLVRETLKKIEESGFKVDSEEMDLVNNYQITIKISKENNNS